MPIFIGKLEKFALFFKEVNLYVNFYRKGYRRPSGQVPSAREGA
jgi:hypothetical protein